MCVYVCVCVRVCSNARAFVSVFLRSQRSMFASVCLPVAFLFSVDLFGRFYNASSHFGFFYVCVGVVVFFLCVCVSVCVCVLFLFVFFTCNHIPYVRTFYSPARADTHTHHLFIQVALECCRMLSVESWSSPSHRIGVCTIISGRRA